MRSKGAANITGNLGAAREMYERIGQQFSGSQFACWARERLDILKSGRAYLNKEGRAQFIIGTTAFGGWAGCSRRASALHHP